MFRYILIFCFLSLFANDSFAREQITEFRSGIEIVWELPEDELIQLAKVKRFDRYAIVRVIKNELQKYPKAYLGKFIKKIYLSRVASVGGVHVGGLAKGSKEGGIIYLTSWNDDKILLVKKLHHELAHHIMFSAPNVREVMAKWEKLLPEDFEYFGNGIAAVRAGVLSPKAGKKLYKAGFITPYAVSAIEEDFAEIASGMMSGDKHFWKNVRDYKIIKQKAELASELYQTIDPDFTLKRMRYRF